MDNSVTNICIMCGSNSGSEMFCPECKEAFIAWKNQYWVNKKMKETIELDELVFEQLYKICEIDKCISDDKDMWGSTNEELLEDIRKAITDTLDKGHWLFQMEGRFDNFINYIKEKIEKYGT